MNAPAGDGAEVCIAAPDTEDTGIQRSRLIPLRGRQVKDLSPDVPVFAGLSLHVHMVQAHILHGAGLCDDAHGALAAGLNVLLE